MKHDLIAHVELGAFGLPAPGCAKCEADMAELDAEIDVAHLAKKDGTCMISVNGQGHFPCDQHFLHRDGKQCWREDDQWWTRYLTDAPEVWTDEGEEPPTKQPCARAHTPRRG